MNGHSSKIGLQVDTVGRPQVPANCVEHLSGQCIKIRLSVKLQLGGGGTCYKSAVG